jgi:hypothetical protein
LISVEGHLSDLLTFRTSGCNPVKIYTDNLEGLLVPAFLTAFSIYIVMPLLGLLAYAMLLRKMRSARIVLPPTIPFFILFFTLGGWLLVLLTVWIWEWSGMASIGMIYLILVAPVLTAVMFWKLRSQRTLSAFHRCAFVLSGAYTCLIIVAVPLALRSPFVGR